MNDHTESEVVHSRGGKGFLDVRDPHDGSLLFRYDPVRQLVEIRKRRVTRLVDLTRLRAVDNQRVE